jgi:hypothetical protein
LEKVLTLSNIASPTAVKATSPLLLRDIYLSATSWVSERMAVLKLPPKKLMERNLKKIISKCQFGQKFNFFGKFQM